MKVSELGEFGLLNILTKMAGRARNNQKTPWQQLIIGIGDDAAAWHGDTSIQLATIDSFIQDIHFTLAETSWEDLGWKAIAINLSDIAAMGGIPKYALVSLSLPDYTKVEDITALYQGMIDLAERFDVALVGGDTSTAPQVAINITVLGSNGDQDKHILKRSAASPGDKIAVSGHLGAAAAGVKIFNEKLQFSSEALNCFQRALQHPYPRVAEGQVLVEQNIKTAIDISDELVQDLEHICQASQVGACIEIDRVPIQPEVKASFGNGALDLALSGGDNYELLFTGSNNAIDGVKKAASCPITIIGEITDGKTNEITLVDKTGKPFNLNRTGWEHFATK